MADSNPEVTAASSTESSSDPDFNLKSEADSGVDVQNLGLAATTPEEEPHVEKRETWGSTIAYLLTLVGYAVGFGNVWRFPFQVRDNGGIAFMIPYTLMLFVVGIPTFFLELAIGQRTRQGVIYAYNDISTAYGGLGIACGWLCFMVGLYYNTVLAYCASYFIDSFTSDLPWSTCNYTDKENQYECQNYLQGKASKYYYYRETLGISKDIDTLGSYNFKLAAYVAVSWFLVWLILWKGTKLVEKVVYFTAVFPYVVLLIFFIANCAIEPQKGWVGAYRLLKPDWEKLLVPETWLKAGSQIFFSLGLGMGCLVVFASYSPARNDCHRDAFYISLINCGTSVFAALVVFPMIGALGFRNYETCYHEMEKIFPDLTQHAPLSKLYDIYFTTNATDWNQISSANPIYVRYRYGELTTVTKKVLGTLGTDEGHFIIDNLSGIHAANKSFAHTIRDCSIGKEATASGGGSGFVFVGFTEAVKHIPGSSFWSVLFFFMLILLGIDSGFGTVEGAVVAIEDITHWGRSLSNTVVCAIMGSLAVFLFPFGWGTYILDLLDNYTANWTLLTIALLECIAVAWVYGLAKIAYDVRLMTGKKPNLYILLSWKYITPSIIITLLIGSIAQFVKQSIKDGGIFYWTFQPEKSEDRSGQHREPLPPHSLATGFLLMAFCMVWVPIQFALRNTKYTLLKGSKISGDFPEEELREERNIDVEKEEDQFTDTEKAIMGKRSLLSLQEHRDRTRSLTSLTDGGRRNTTSSSGSGSLGDAKS